jgi:hypothetical protein
MQESEKYVFGIILHGQVKPIETLSMEKAVDRLKILASIESKERLDDRGEYFMLPESVVGVLNGKDH